MTDSTPRPVSNRVRPTSDGPVGKVTELYTLGDVRVVREGTDETSKLGPRHVALLVYLYHEARPLHPTELVDLLGRGQDDEKELDRLHKAITWLRNNVTGVDISVSADTIETYGGVRLDTREVDAAIDSGDPAHVARLYVGEFLERFESGAPAFDEWAQRERGRLQRAWSNAILAAARESERHRDWAIAALWWMVLVSRAPMRGEAVAGLLRAYASAESWDEAAAAYADYLGRLEAAGIAKLAQPVARVIGRYRKLAEMKPGLLTDAAVTGAPHAAPKPASDKAAAREEEAAAPPGPPPVQAGRRSRPAPRAESERSVESTSERAKETEPPRVAESEAVLPELAADAPPETADAPAGETSAESAATHGVEVPDAAAPRDARRPAEPGDRSEAELDLGATSRVPEVAEPPEIPDAPSAPASTRPRLTPRREGSGAKREVTAARKRPRSTTDRAGPGERRRFGNVMRSLVGALRAASRIPVIAGRGLAALFTSRRSASPRGDESPGAAAAAGRAARGVPSPAVGALLRRHWYVPAGAVLLALAVFIGPRVVGGIGGAGDEGLPSAAGAPKARVSLPKVPVPRVTVRTPAFVETSVSRIARMLSGPILSSPGEWLLVADVQVYPPQAEPPRSLQPADPSATAAELEERGGEAGDGDVGLAGAGPLVTGEAVEGETEGGQRSEEEAPSPDAGEAEARPEGPGRPDSATPAGAEASQADSTPGAGMTTDAALQEPVDSAAAVQAAPEDSLPGDRLGGAGGATGTPTAPARRARSDDPLPEDPSWSPLSGALTVALESEFKQARYFSVAPRERAMSALAKMGSSRAQALPVGDALAVASAADYAAVVAAKVTRRPGGRDSLEVRVLSPVGDTLYGVAAEVSEDMTILEALSGLGRAVRRRLGEPGGEIENSLPATQLLTSSMPALEAYAEARTHLYGNRYPQAIAAAEAATEADSTFAFAYRALAEAYALQGLRPRARSALEMAWELSGRLSERERYRLLADRLAWDGQFTDAALTYDELFKRYRDDAGALRSLALVQRTMGARGGGEGNLIVAHSLDAYGWPRLSQLSRFLGYSGPLPDVDSLAAAAAAAAATEADTLP